jgi:hypothetical protein
MPNPGDESPPTVEPQADRRGLTRTGIIEFGDCFEKEHNGSGPGKFGVEPARLPPL